MINDNVKKYIKDHTKVDEESGCHLWTGVSQYGAYGRVPTSYGQRPVTRIVWETNVGPIPPHMSVRHSCGNRLCINPEHLALNPAGRGRPSRLSVEQIKAVREAAEQGESYAKIGEKFGITPANARYVISRHYRWVE